MKQHALDYAKGRTAMRKGEIRILNAAGDVTERIPFDESARRVSHAG